MVTEKTKSVEKRAKNVLKTKTKNLEGFSLINRLKTPWDFSLRLDVPDIQREGEMGTNGTLQSGMSGERQADVPVTC